MSQLILTRSSQFHRAIRTRSSFPLTVRVGKFFLFFSMTFMIGILSFLYLMKFTEIQTKGYQLQKIEIARAKLVASREEQSTGIAKLKTLEEIKRSPIAQTMVPARASVFVKDDGSVAQLPTFAFSKQ